MAAPLPHIIAGIDSENQVRIEVEIQGLYKKIPYGAILDTGFSGGLLLPLITAVDLGLEKVGGGNVVLADGSIKTLPIFLCKVKMGDKTSDVSTIVMGNDVLIGMELLAGYQVCVASGKGQVTVEEEGVAKAAYAQYAQYDRLSGIIRGLTGGY
jgi:predicted aspartyl protease